MAEETDFKIDWDLPDYPQLPKMFTSAKAAKKRKHREFIMTDEVLDRVVKIPAAAKTGEWSQLRCKHTRHIAHHESRHESMP
jgi:hypothetical protein